MLKKIITIIIILLIVAIVVLGGAWLLVRKQAVKTGSEAPTFKEFISLGNRGVKPGTSDDGLSSDFTPDGSAGPQTPGDGPDSGSGSDNGGDADGVTDVSQFTNDTITPNTGSFVGSTGSMGTNPSSGSVESPTVPSQAPVITPPAGSAAVSTGVECSEADVNITFTQAELDKMDALQRRFDAIAGLLHSDEDVENMRAIYDALALKEQNIIELTNYCETKTPLLADPILKRKVPTPFWRTTQAVNTFINGEAIPAANTALSPGIPGLGAINNVGPTIDVGNSNTGRSALERILRINFW